MLSFAPPPPQSIGLLGLNLHMVPSTPPPSLSGPLQRKKKCILILRRGRGSKKVFTKESFELNLEVRF